MNVNENFVLKIKGNTYSIEFPRVGEYRAIEVMKQNLSLNAYGSMARSMTSATEEALDMIDVEAYFSILCPKLIEDLKCSSFSELGLLDYIEIKKVFKESFIPWWNEIEKLLRPAPVKKVVKDEETKQD